VLELRNKKMKLYYIKLGVFIVLAFPFACLANISYFIGKTTDKIGEWLEDRIMR